MPLLLVVKLEKILNLKPDLILGLTWLKSSYKLLSRIAPTVLFHSPSMYDFKERLRYVAQVLGKSDRPDQVRLIFVAFLIL